MHKRLFYSTCTRTRDPLSRRFRVFLISCLEPFAKVHAPEAHVMTTADVRAQLDFAIDFVQLLHDDVDFGQGLTETRPPTRQKNIQRNEKKKYETLQIHTVPYNETSTIFCYKRV